MRDRVAQQAAKLVLEPIFEADFRVVLVWVSAEAVGDAGDGATRVGFIEGVTHCGGV